ncbi:hypothetical protein EH31_09190 [Erythrobacter longus]|uniref:guanylate cyclase n=1 Tax=Erythrobacter longus TaxID=1044 RepID=A0A074MA04_ERYLO|nr:GGDEF domain-containing protein [Erythrobacter longus]KEO90254.1 hypothetical protein EH31_09190 [Erythrobacter longus]
MLSSPDLAYCLTAGALNTLFPMHCILDDEGRIVQAGSTLSKVMRRAVVGEALFDLFEIKRPRSLHSLADLQSYTGPKFVLRAVFEAEHPLEFRCVATAMEAGGKTLLIDFAFSADFLDLFSLLQLNASDFKPNDPSLDLIYTIETQRTLVEDSQKLTLALERSRKEAEHAANIDLLTGIANRRFLSSYLRQEPAPIISRCGGFLLHLDLNKFKSINDTSGHSAGDAVLQHTARILDEAAGETGFAARLGGDEFVLLVRGYTSRAAIESLSIGICQRISEPIAHGGHVLQVSTLLSMAVLLLINCSASLTSHSTKQNAAGKTSSSWIKRCFTTITSAKRSSNRSKTGCSWANSFRSFNQRLIRGQTAYPAWKS